MTIIKHVVEGDQQYGWSCWQCRFSTRGLAEAAAHDGVKIRTENICPPIPSRNFDWSAVDDSTYDGPGSPIGHGKSEQDAINDLTEQLAEKSTEPYCSCGDREHPCTTHPDLGMI